MPNQIVKTSERQLPDGEPIWRYVSLRTLLFHLDSLVFIPSVAKLGVGDPFEGKFYQNIAWFNDAFMAHYQGEAKQIEEWILENYCENKERRESLEGYLDGTAGFCRDSYMDFIRKTRFAWCWFRSVRESAAMWNVYGNQGVAIRTTVGKVAKVLEATGRKFIYEPMTYVDHRTGRSPEFDPEAESDFQRLLRPFFLKREEYESEQEVRFVIGAAERSAREGLLLKNVNPQDWIEEIRLWPGLKTAEAHSLRKTIMRLLPHVDCSKSDLFSESSLGIGGAVEDFVTSVENAADSDFQTGQDGIPSPLKEL